MTCKTKKRWKISASTGRFLVWRQRTKRWVVDRDEYCSCGDVQTKCLSVENEKAKAAEKREKPPIGFDFSKRFYVLPDITEFQSPIDGSMISSRSKLRAHERRHDVRQAGDFKPGEIVKRENERVAEARKIAKGEFFQWM